MKKKTALFFVESISLCHLARMITIAKTFPLDEWRVLMACGFNHQKHVWELGLNAISIPCVSPKKVYGRIESFRFLYTTEDLETYYKFDLDTVRRINPDLLVYDMRLDIPIVGRELNIPVVSVTHGIWSSSFHSPYTVPYYVSNRIPLPSSHLNWLSGTSLGRNVNGILETLFVRPLHRFYKNHRIKSLTYCRDYYSVGDFSWVADLPEIVPLANAPESITHVGPALWDPPVSLRGGHHVRIRKNRPSIYFSMGTSVFPHDKVTPSVTKLIKAGYRVILQTGGASVPPLPDHPHLQVYDFVSNHQVLQQVNVMISHGGVTTSYEAVRAKTPIVALPAIPDQQWNSDQFVKAGIARVLNPAKTTPQILLETVDSLMMDKACQSRLEILSQRIIHFPLRHQIYKTLRNYQTKPEIHWTFRRNARLKDEASQKQIRSAV